MTILMKGVQVNVAKANGGNGRKIYRAWALRLIAGNWTGEREIAENP